MKIPEKLPVLIGTYEGMEMYRLVTNVNICIKKQNIDVVYEQWQLSPTGKKVEHQTGLCYLIKDLPAIPAVITGGETVVITPYSPAVPEVLDGEGNVITEAIPEVQEVTEVTPIVVVQEAIPEFEGYADWGNYASGGLTLAQVIYGSVDATLLALPMNVENGHIIKSH